MPGAAGRFVWVLVHALGPGGRELLRIGQPSIERGLLVERLVQRLVHQYQHLARDDTGLPRADGARA
jgi:hypothetical protein